MKLRPTGGVPMTSIDVDIELKEVIFAPGDGLASSEDGYSFCTLESEHGRPSTSSTRLYLRRRGQSVHGPGLSGCRQGVSLGPHRVHL